MPAPVAIRPPQRAIPRGPHTHLRDLSRIELGDWVRRELGGPGYRADQMFQWLHRHRATDPSRMTNLPAMERVKLAERADWARLEIAEEQQAIDGTRKLRLRTPDHAAIETVLIPNEGRGLTQCVSSMVGCSLTCAFCATASLGFQRNLTTWEIVDQVYLAQDALEREGIGESTGRITNIVFMGMGEPLHNYNHVARALRLLMDPDGAGIAGRRITVSTAGFVPGIRRFAGDGLGDDIGLAISLNATTDEVRDRIMPINRKWKIADIMAAVRSCPTPRRRLVTFEYVLLAGINDLDGDPDRLAALLHRADVNAQVNLIAWNPHPHASFHRPGPERVRWFLDRCRALGLSAYVRAPRGEDIAAACGQLALERGG